MKNLAKPAYNLAELLIVIAIISFLILLTFTTIKPSKKIYPVAYNTAFTSLEQAVYNSYETLKASGRKFPAEDRKKTPEQSARELCSLLAANPEEEDSEGYINTVVYNCNENFKPIDRSGKDYFFKDENMAFQAANSMKFYISKPEKILVPNAVSKTQKVGIKYFIVWVDLNGSRTPNTADYAGKGFADIVPFIVTTKGAVLPAGYPTTDVNYLSAYVQYPLSAKKQMSELTTYYDAQTAAYGGREYPIFDEYSIRDSLQKALRNTAAEIKGYSPKRTDYDKICKPEKPLDEPLCRIRIKD